MSYWSKRIKSFTYALRGIKKLVSSEAHAKIHLLASFFALGMAIWLEISTLEWIFVLAAITFVWLAEAVNTSIERTLNLLHPSQDERVADIKDIAAGAVLIAAIFALTSGIIIFGPALYKMFFQAV